MDQKNTTATNHYVSNYKVRLNAPAEETPAGYVLPLDGTHISATNTISTQEKHPMTTQNNQQNEQSSETDQPEKKSNRNKIIGWTVGLLLVAGGAGYYFYPEKYKQVVKCGMCVFDAPKTSIVPDQNDINTTVSSSDTTAAPIDTTGDNGNLHPVKPVVAVRDPHAGEPIITHLDDNDGAFDEVSVTVKTNGVVTEKKKLFKVNEQALDSLSKSYQNHQAVSSIPSRC